MAGQLTIDTLKASSGVLATQNGMTGIPKAWVYFNGVGGSVFGSFNVSSVTSSAAGRYTVNFTTAMPNTNYGACFTIQYNGSNNALACRIDTTITPKTTSSISFQSLDQNWITSNTDAGNVIIFGA